MTEYNDPGLGYEEYDRRVVELHERLPPVPSREQEREVRRAELELAIDHRLGKDFPAERRERLWQVMQEVDKRRLRLVGRYLLGRLLHRRPVRSANRLAGWMVDHFAEVLDPRELESFFELGGGKPVLPLDEERRRSDGRGR